MSITPRFHALCIQTCNMEPRGTALRGGKYARSEKREKGMKGRGLGTCEL